MSPDPDWSREADVLCRYLASRAATTEIVTRYAAAVERRLGQVRRDMAVGVALRFPAMLGPLDAGAALLDPDHQLRRRLVLMTAILETTPENCDLFLPRDHTLLDAIGAWIGALVVAPLKAVVGVPLFFLLTRAAR